MDIFKVLIDCVTAAGLELKFYLCSDGYLHCDVLDKGKVITSRYVDPNKHDLLAKQVLSALFYDPKQPDTTS